MLLKASDANTVNTIFERKKRIINSDGIRITLFPTGISNFQIFKFHYLNYVDIETLFHTVSIFKSIPYNVSGTPPTIAEH